MERRAQLLLVAACLAVACDNSTPDRPDASSDPGQPAELGPGQFPEGFLFGAATAGFQVEMGCPTLPDEVCVDTASDWYAYMTSPETVNSTLTYLNGEDPADVGPGHWELYESDYQLAREGLGLNAFRMGIEWSRIFPTSTEGVEGHEALSAIADADAVATYRAMFESMREQGLEPLVTLNHYTLPLWIHDGVGCHVDFDGCTDRGWLQPERIVPEMAKYAGFVAQEYGDLVDWWFTQNEPFAVLLPGYLQPTEERSNPPAVMMEAEAALTAFQAMIDAHVRTVDAVRVADRVDADGDGAATIVGLVYAMAPVFPANPDDPQDQAAVEDVFYLWNLAFLDAVAGGILDDDMDGHGEPQADLAGRMDVIGLNYKQSMIIEGTGQSLLPELSPLLTLNPFTIDLTQEHPRGIYEMVELLQVRYGLPTLITENNGQGLWQGDFEYETRIVVETLQWVSEAIRDGFTVYGWVYWSFMDNIEWNHGMDVDLGLYAVDPEDPTRVREARALVPTLAQITAANTVPDDLLETYPIDTAGPATGGVPEVFMVPVEESDWP